MTHSIAWLVNQMQGSMWVVAVYGGVGAKVALREQKPAVDATEASRHSPLGRVSCRQHEIQIKKDGSRVYQ